MKRTKEEGRNFGEVQKRMTERTHKSAKQYTRKTKHKMKQNEQHENYGLYITQNTFTMKFYCFSRDVADDYWVGKPCKKASGKTSQEALSNYKNGVYETDT
jgi:hypothetical protein